MNVISFSGLLDPLNAGFDAAEGAVNTAESAYMDSYNRAQDTYQSGQEVYDSASSFGQKKDGFLSSVMGHASGKVQRQEQNMTPLHSTVNVAKRVPVRPIMLNPQLASSVMKNVSGQAGAQYTSGYKAATREYGPSAGLQIPTWAYVAGGIAAVVGGYMLLKR